ncbi:MAG: energy transducer TonB [Saprospiraceae bacterium]
MIKNLSILLFLIFCACCEEQVEQCPCFSDHQNPIYKGCEPGAVYDMNDTCSVIEFYKQIFTVLKYPQEAIVDSVEGRVTIGFDIFENGTIGNFTIEQDTLGHGLAHAAIEAAKTLNDKGFCPARESCEAVVFHYILPVLFVLH